MDITTLKSRFAERNPLYADVALAVALTLLVWAQTYAITHIHPALPMPPRMLERVEPRDSWPLAYALTAITFLPLAFRRRAPWVAVAFAGIGAAVYELRHLPPTFTILAPMIAIYSLAAYSKTRRNALVALLLAGLAFSVPAFIFSFEVRWVADTVGSFALLAIAALLGDTARNRREYIAEVEARAAEAERNREEEARRRVDEERVRIARDVHDIVAHSLSIVTVQAAAAEAVLDRDPAQARESIRNIRSTGREALAELRSMLDVLRTGDSDAPLSPASDLTYIEQLIAPVREAGIDIRLVVDGDVQNVPAYASVSAYRLIQEALTNVVRHAKATTATVSVRVASRQLDVQVTDDGKGASSETVGEAPGHGIRGMRERVEALGGSFSFGPAERGGFEVSATIPYPRSAS